jgi:hypothetical protein
MLNKGPWSRLDRNEPFVAGAPPKPPEGNFYPAGATKDEIEAWMKSLPAGRAGPGDRLLHHDSPRLGRHVHRVPYSVEYQGRAGACGVAAPRAAALTQQPTLKTFLEKRADALISNDYYASDVAWMELDASLEPDDRSLRGLRGRVVQLQGCVRSVHHRARRSRI